MTERYSRMLAVLPTDDGGIEVRLAGLNGEALAPAKELIAFIERGIRSIERQRLIPEPTAAWRGVGRDLSVDTLLR